MAWYIDTSALVKLIVAEAESEALRTWIREASRDPVTSDLSRTELVRAVRRVAPELAATARVLLDSVTVLGMRAAMFDSAGRLDPPSLRTLDALHLVAALELGDDLDGMITYDTRMADAAQANGIVVIRPGAEAA